MYNIVYLHTHDLGRCIDPYGYAVGTPNLMALAEGAALFRHAYSTAPTCSPSRAGMLTGMSPHRAGMIGLSHRGFGLTDEGRRAHLASFLSSHGYDTVLCGFQHEIEHGRERELGYDRVLPADGGQKGETGDFRVARRAAEYLAGEHDRPFFLSVGLTATHREFPELDRTQANPDYVLPPHPIYDGPQNREDWARFILAARNVDACAGIVLEALRESGRDEDTIVLFTTDHGIAFPHMKCTLYDTGIGVAMMLRYPGMKASGRAVDALVSQLDVFPTLCDLTGIETPDWVEGKSLVPLLEGRAERVRDQLFAEVTYHAAYEPMRCIRTDRYKLIRLYDDFDRYVLPNIDDGLTKQFLLDHGFKDERRTKEMLFDLYLDPVERVNVADDPRYREVREDLSARLDAWMKETDDPLAAGNPVPKPKGAIANRRDSLSPNANEFE